MNNLLTPIQQAKVEGYVENLYKWQQKINLISNRLSRKDLYNNILEAIELYHLIKKLHPQAHKILDIGSGNGFPGIILSILELECYLVDLKTKKTAFLNHTAAILDLPVIVYNCNVKDLSLSVDVIVSKACTSVSNLIDMSSNIHASAIIACQSIHQKNDVYPCYLSKYQNSNIFTHVSLDA
jgi:16S rRNA (guanine527-N7)-methyltransferase